MHSFFHGTARRAFLPHLQNLQNPQNLPAQPAKMRRAYFNILRPLLAAIRMRRALSLIKPSASFWL